MVITELAEDLLAHYAAKPLTDHYDVYQQLMDYWSETMQDDLYAISADGWKAQTQRILVKDGKGKERDKGWTCDLIPKPYLVARYFVPEQNAITHLETALETVSAELSELEEEHGGDEGAFAEIEKVNRASVSARKRELTGLYADEDDANAELEALNVWLELSARQTELKKQLKDADAELDEKAYATYPTLSVDAIKTLVVEDKWLSALGTAIYGEMTRISQTLTGRVLELAKRYETPLPALGARVSELEAKVGAHLEKMGYRWN